MSLFDSLRAGDGRSHGDGHEGAVDGALPISLGGGDYQSQGFDIGAGEVVHGDQYANAIPRDSGDVYGNVGNIDPSTLLPMFGALPDASAAAGAPSAYKPEYLHYQPKQWYERLAYNTGFAYLFGIGTGGCYGIVNGFSTSPSSKFRIRINSILNKSGRFGSRFGNSLGAIAMMFSCLEELTDRVHFEEYVPQVDEDIFNPLVAAGITGVLYKSTQGPKTMFLAGALGATAAGSFRAVSGLWGGQISGKRSGLFF